MTQSLPSTKKADFFASLKNPARVKSAWSFFQKLPQGKTLFSKIMGWLIPYTGSISPRVQKVEPGYAQVQLRDRRKIRNHLQSVHALALANLGEFCGGLALFSRVPPQAQAILVELHCTYLKKARGLLTASAHCHVTEFQTATNYTMTTEIRNHGQEVVALVNTTWRIRI